MEPSVARAPPRRPGRPLSFDREAALRRAMLAFWRHGYETTSVADLTAAMGISPPSLYAAFGDKKQLFLEAMRLYAGDPELMARTFQSAPSACAAAHALLVAAATAYTGEDTPKGCLLAGAAASGSEAAADVREAVAEVRRGVGRRLQARVERDLAEGLLPAGADAAALAGMVLAVLQGLAVLARDGTPRAALLAIAETAMQAWPRQPG